MQIIGWVRVGDRAACGGTVAEALSMAVVHDRPLTFRGARMACRKQGCVVVGHCATSTLANGREMVHHGHLTSGGCPLLSTLNDIAGVGVGGIGGVAGSAAIAPIFPATARNWVPAEPGQETCDEQVQLHVEGNVALAVLTGLPYYIETPNGRALSGRADAQGLLPRIETWGEDAYTVLWGDEALAKMNGAAE